ncbi:bifunctional diguanylate cyclase/phosphodiesterase [Shewanella sp. UCD-KL12]|uniref:putative bifunctional diguanylate cyclase/phosphodiesterase n=1 Tax=Shewanella sp. UCD-KL12 TaxID=1917163 RepID=UPI002115DFFA|nr:EAL domain-containing protein [Shewanella sp. UCD-KL12]
MLKIRRPSLVYVVPALAFLLYFCLMSAEYFYARDESRTQAVVETMERIDKHLLRMQHIVELAMSEQDSNRVEEEVSLAAIDLEVMVYTVLQQNSEIRFANHLVWRGSSAKLVIDGYDSSMHEQASLQGDSLTYFNQSRLSIQAYSPLTITSDMLIDSNNIIYLEYDVSPLLTKVDKRVLQSAIRSWGVTFIGLLLFLVFYHIYLIRPLRLMAKQASLVSHDKPRRIGASSDWHLSSVNVAFSELEAIKSHLINFYDKLERSEKQLNDSQQRWLFAIEVSRNGIWDWNFASGEVFLSDRWKEMLGYNSDELASELSTWESLLHPEDKADALNTLNQYLNNELDEFESVHRLKHKNGHYIWVLDRGMVVEWDEQGKAIRMIGTHADVSNEVRNKQAVIHQAKHDLLTDLPNRSCLLDELYSLKENHQHASAGIYLIGLDNFKLINEALGHHHGDRLLIQLAARLSSYFSSNALVARLGADEFVVLTKNLSDDSNTARRHVHALASQIRQIIARSFNINNQSIAVSASVGACFIEQSIQISPEQIIKQAGVAMQQVKDRGRDGYLLYTAEMEEVAQHSLFIQSELRGAIAAKQLSLMYQPIIDRNGTVVSAEALLRWHHPEMGNISPATFIPLAEGSALIEELGRWVLIETCDFIKRLEHKALQLDAVAINVSARQFNQEEFVDGLFKHIAEHGVHAKTIELELTEYALLNNLASVKQVMLRLKQAGISIAIDDFGTGYSSLSYLQSIPLSRLKIDASFVSEIGKNSSSNAIVKAIIDMAHALNLQVVAEGVETQAQYEFLMHEGCDKFQGYLFSRPLTEADFIGFIASAPTKKLMSVS